MLSLGLGSAGIPAQAAEFARSFDFVVDPTRARLPPGVRILGCWELDSQGERADAPASELSGLAWDADEGRLYAVSDRGWLVWLEPRFEEGALVGITRTAGYALSAATGEPLKRPVDAEGLVLEHGNNGIPGDSRLVVSFETPARVARHDIRGRELERLPLPAELADRKAYQSSNNALEAIAASAAGLVASPQRPLRSQRQDRLTLHELAGTSVWTYPPRDAGYSSLSDLAALPDGRLLALERVYRGIFSPLVIALERFSLPADAGEIVPETVVEFSSATGFRVDNFEGLAVVDQQHVFLVSDDNQSAWQRTLLLYLEIPR
jgi:hypothetical protein